jgi:hypothetical protein
VSGLSIAQRVPFTSEGMGRSTNLALSLALTIQYDCQETPPVQYSYPSRIRKRLWCIITRMHTRRIDANKMSFLWMKLESSKDPSSTSESFFGLVLNQRDDICLSSVKIHKKKKLLNCLYYPDAQGVAVKKYYKRLPACPCQCFVQILTMTSPRHEVMTLGRWDLHTIPSMR